MTEIFRMPDVGEGMHEGEIASWLIKVGDVVKEEDAIAEIQNDKLLQEILSPYSGKVTKLFVEAGTVVEVGAPLIEFDGDGTGVAAGVASSTLVEVAATSEVTKTADQALSPASTPTEEGSVGVGVGREKENAAPVINGKLRAMPSVRRYARQNHIDLSEVTPTGRHGNITLMDVKNFVPGAGVVNVPTGELENVEIPQPISIEQSVPKHAVEEKVGRVRMSPIRKAIAKNMTHQKQEIPHVTLFDEVEVSKLMAHRAQFKAAALEEDTKLTYLAYVVKAQAAVNKKFPELNAHADMANFEIIYPESIHIGIAVDTPLGLFVPVVRNADQKSILAIAKEIVDLAERARAGALTGDVASGSTVTISNIGSARGGWFTPVINVNESTILGLGTIQKQPIIDESGEIIVGNMMKLSLSFDHRLIDGMLAQRAMNYLKKLLEDPSYMLMEV